MLIKTRLMTPGPTELVHEAQLSQARPIIHHRTNEFIRLFAEVREGLKYLFQTESDVLIFASSGSGAMEGAVANLLSPGDKALVANTGKFGERWLALCKAYNVETREIFVERGLSVEPERIAEALEREPEIKAVFIQDSESSTGARNPTRAIAEITRNHKACLVIDAITGLGVHEIKTDEWGLDVVIGGSQKALGLPPGLAFASVSEKAWKMIEESKSPRFYFDFKKEAKNQARGQTAYTPAISLITGLRESLLFIRNLTLEGLIENAATLAEMTRQAAQAMGLKLFAHSPSDAITAVRAPEEIDSGEIIKAYKKDFGITIANGQDEMKGRIFRFAHLGYTDYIDTIGAIAALEIILIKLGLPIQIGQGVTAAQKTFTTRREAALASSRGGQQ